MEKKILNECKDGVKATDDDVTTLLNKELPTTATAKCLAACAQEKFGIVSLKPYLIEFCVLNSCLLQIDGGKFSPDALKAVGAKKYEGNDKAIAIFNELVEECKNLSHDDKCELAAKISECMHGAAVKRNIDPKKGIQA